MRKKSISVLYLIFCCLPVHAGIMLGGTRLVYDDGKKEESISIENKGTMPYLIQSWVEEHDATKSHNFLITPPLFRLDGDKKNTLRIFKLDKELPVDRESLFFLNVKSIPGGTVDGNTLQIAIRNRLKLIYRPKALQKDIPESRTGELTWIQTGRQLKVINPTPYYQNFMFVKINGKDIELKEKNYAPPFSDTYLNTSGVRGDHVSWKIINDYGAVGKLHMSVVK